MVSWYHIIGILHCLSRRELGQAAVDYLSRFVDKDIPWQSLLLLAEMEGVAGFLHLHLKDSNLFAPPQSIVEELDRIYRKIHDHTMQTMYEMEAFSNKLVQVGIPVVALQGLSLIKLYKHYGLRPLSDVDLLVQSHHRDRLFEVLRELGYRVPDSAYPTLLYKNGHWLDIHTHILNLERVQSRRYIFPENIHRMWERTLSFFDDHQGMFILDPFDNFIALSAHALKHSYSKIIWLVDLHETLLKLIKEPDAWNNIIQYARFWRQEKVVLYALILLQRIFGLKLSSGVKRELGIHHLSLLEKYLLRLKIRGFSSNLLCPVLWLCNIKRTGNKIKFVKETVFPKKKIMAQLIKYNTWNIQRSAHALRFAHTVMLLGRDLKQAFWYAFPKND
jgi:hypothetical protein